MGNGGLNTRAEVSFPPDTPFFFPNYSCRVKIVGHTCIEFLRLSLVCRLGTPLFVGAQAHPDDPYFIKAIFTFLNCCKSHLFRYNKHDRICHQTFRFT